MKYEAGLKGTVCWNICLGNPNTPVEELPPEEERWFCEASINNVHVGFFKTEEESITCLLKHGVLRENIYIWD